MPMLDMPVREMEMYQGTNPRPDDFDEYWDKALGEMKSIDPQISVTPAPFHAPGAECFDLYFTGVGGARIYAQYLRPAHISAPVPALVCFHGYGDGNRAWTEKLPYVLAGMAVFAMDARGQGGKSQDLGGVMGNTQNGHIIRGLDEPDPQKLLFRHIFLDTAQLAGIVMEMDGIDPSKVYAHGGSQGGGLTIACAALEPRIAKAAAVYPFLSDYKRVWDMDLAKDAYDELRNYFRRFDPMHVRENEVFTKLGYIDIQNLASRIKADTLIFTGLQDSICPPSTQYAVYNKLTCRKKHLLYPDYGHEDLKWASDIVFDFLVNDVL